MANNFFVSAAEDPFLWRQTPQCPNVCSSEFDGQMIRKSLLTKTFADEVDHWTGVPGNWCIRKVLADIWKGVVSRLSRWRSRSERGGGFRETSRRGLERVPSECLIAVEIQIFFAKNNTRGWKSLRVWVALYLFMSRCIFTGTELIRTVIQSREEGLLVEYDGSEYFQYQLRGKSEKRIRSL